MPRPCIFSVLLGIFLLLPACSRQPLAPPGEPELGRYSAVSFLSDELVVDALSFSLIRPKEQAIDVSAWYLDRTWRELFEAGVLRQEREFLSLALDPAEAERALSLREDRWKKVSGSFSQALLDLLFRRADEQGIRFLFLLSRPGASATQESASRYPFHKGLLGVYCRDEKKKEVKAYPYFFFTLTLWDVSRREKLYQLEVTPSLTSTGDFFGERGYRCKEIVELKDHSVELEMPMKQAMEKLTRVLFGKMGWAKAAL